MTKWPDFGKHQYESDGVVLECDYIAPGLTLSDLTSIFIAAKVTGNEYAGNPSEWPDVKGILAVLESVYTALGKM